MNVKTILSNQAYHFFFADDESGGEKNHKLTLRNEPRPYLPIQNLTYNIALLSWLPIAPFQYTQATAYHHPGNHPGKHSSQFFFQRV